MRNNIACYACFKQKVQIKGDIRVVFKEELIQLIKDNKNNEFESGLPACQKCIKQVEKVYNFLFYIRAAFFFFPILALYLYNDVKMSI